MLRRAARPLLSALLVAQLPTFAAAALNPENLAVVVDAKRQASRALANHDVALRPIPPQQVIPRSGLGCQERIGVARIREQHLAPLLADLAAFCIAAPLQGAALRHARPEAP